MRFHVNRGIVFTLAILWQLPAEEKARWWDGRREIWISAEVPPDRRIDELRHELSHIYDYYCGQPSDDESRAQRHATIERGLAADLAEQGGEAALIAMQPADAEPVEAPEPAPVYVDETDGQHAPPEEVWSPEEGVVFEPDTDAIAESSRIARGGRVYCSCGHVMNEAMILTHEPIWSDEHNGQIVHREGYCGVHGAHVSWWEGIDGYGKPNGEAVRAPVFTKNPRAVMDFLARLRVLHAR